MFFQGTLQEGIASAVQDSKLVICFVTNDGDESKSWEEMLLTDSSIASKIHSEAVLLRLIAGSEEALYLAAIFPLPQTPTLVMIRNGELKEYIAAGVSRESFLERVRKAVGLAQTPPILAEAAEQAETIPQVHVEVGHRSSAQDVSTSAPPATSASAVPSGNSSSATDTPASSSNGERSNESETNEKRRRAKGKGRAEAEIDPAPVGAGLPREEVRKATETLKKQQLDAQDERRRILQQIEKDRIARKARDEERKAQREAAFHAEQDQQQTGDGSTSTGGFVERTSMAPPPSAHSSRSRQSAECSLQVRDFDGSTIRTRLPSNSTLGKDVRKWVDANRPAEDVSTGPYTFKVLLTPLPNRAISETEETKTLQDLGLAPSSTLILVPVPSRFSSAYSAGPDAGLFARIVGFLIGIVNSIALFFRTLFSTAGAPPATEDDSSRSAPSSSRVDNRHGRVTGLRNRQNDQRDYQLYNGNSLNFEPRPDEDEEIQN